MNMLLLTLFLLGFSAVADDDVVEVPTPQTLPAPEASGAQISPEQAKAMLEKLKAGQQRKQEENRLLEELDKDEE